MFDTIAENVRRPYTALANQPNATGGSTVQMVRMTNREPSARVPLRRRSLPRPTSRSRATSVIGPHGRSTITAAVTLPSSFAPGARMASGTAVRSADEPGMRRRTAPATRLSRTSAARTPVSRATRRTVRSGIACVTYFRSSPGPAGSGCRFGPSLASSTSPTSVPAARLPAPGGARAFCSASACERSGGSSIVTACAMVATPSPTVWCTTSTTATLPGVNPVTATNLHKGRSRGSGVSSRRATRSCTAVMPPPLSVTAGTCQSQSTVD